MNRGPLSSLRWPSRVGTLDAGGSRCVTTIQLDSVLSNKSLKRKIEGKSGAQRRRCSELALVAYRGCQLAPGAPLYGGLPKELLCYVRYVQPLALQ